MEDRSDSRTAMGVAYLRAAHQVFDAAPLIFEDPVALALLGEGAAERLRTHPENLRTPGALALRSHVVLRSRFTEDRLEAAVARGVSQYVLLGAGYDTFALRQPGWASRLRILELDHPATQDAKRARLAAAGFTPPANVRFATLDLSRPGVREGLAANGVALDEPAFFALLGVIMYLEAAAVAGLLATLAAFPAGSELALTFAQPEPAEGSRLAQRVESLGEPWRTLLMPAEMETALLRAGFSRVEFLTPEQAEVRYYRQRPRDLPVPRRASIVSATV